MQIEFDAQEVVACRQMLEVALKAVGRDAIPAFVRLDDKFEGALAANAPKSGREAAGGMPEVPEPKVTTQD